MPYTGTLDASKPTVFPNGIQAVVVGTTGTQEAAITSLTDSTGATPNNTVENVPAAVAAATDTTAASLTSTNAALTAAENNLSDLTAKVNAILTALRGAGIIAT